MKLFAKKSLGQHFLNSKHVLNQIISASNIKNGDNILEIGPGTGVLTEALLAAGANIVAVEKDSRAIEFLRIKFDKEWRSGQLKIVEGDVLDDEPNSSIVKWLNSSDSYYIVANIPYYITGAILEKFLEHEPRPNRMILLVQKEVAERIMARDGKESILSVSVKVFGTPKIIATVPPGAFTPPPNVDSAILAIENVSDARFVENKLEIPRFFGVLKAGFAHKRKFLASNIGKNAKEALFGLGMSEKARAEDVSVEKWLKLGAKLQA